LPLLGVELASDAVEQLGPSGFELTIHQALGFGPVGDRGKTVVPLQVIETRGLHLSRQPFPSVEADLHGERVFHHAADLRHFYPRWVNRNWTRSELRDLVTRRAIERLHPGIRCSPFFVHTELSDPPF
jgi:hypothetical protein